MYIIPQPIGVSAPWYMSGLSAKTTQRFGETF